MKGNTKLIAMYFKRFLRWDLKAISGELSSKDFLFVRLLVEGKLENLEFVASWMFRLYL